MGAPIEIPPRRLPRASTHTLKSMGQRGLTCTKVGNCEAIASGEPPIELWDEESPLLTLASPPSDAKHKTGKKGVFL